MSKKIRLIRTMITEYEPDPDYYEEGATIEEMAELDANADDLESVFTELESDQVEWEILDEEGNVVSQSQSRKSYKTYFQNGELVIDFIGDIGTDWREGRIRFDVSGMSLEAVNKKVEQVVQLNFVGKK